MTRRNRKGVVAVEFALLSPMILGVCIGAAQLAAMLHARQLGSSVAGAAIVLSAQGMEPDAIPGHLEPLAAATKSTVAIVADEIVVTTSADLFCHAQVVTRLPLVEPLP